MALSRDTIVAPITAPGAAAISVLRLSGELTPEIVMKVCEAGGEILSNPRELRSSQIFDLKTEGSILDHALVVYFKGPKSFTGEEVVEFQVHGSAFVVRRLIENILLLGARLARPGEFSERAFLNGRIDLSQAEAIADLISAETESQAKIANEQLAGKISSAISDFGEPLRDLLAEVEASIDFPEEDIEPLSYDSWIKVLKERVAALDLYIDSFRSGKLYREGAQVVLCGMPNAGKSSLLNSLLGEDRVIVTDIAGTTRDSIEERISLDGLFVRLWDTAGLDEEDAREINEVERLGIERSWKKAAEADLVLFVIDASDDFRKQGAQFRKVCDLNRPILCLLNKVDISSGKEKEAEAIFGKSIPVSAETAIGITELRDELRERLLSGIKSDSSLLISNQRHFEALKDSREALLRAISASDKKEHAEFIALELRAALGALNDIIGVTHTEDILGRIFSKFCIGK